MVVLLLFVPQGLFYPFKCPIGELQNVFSNLAQKQGSFLCSVCHRWQFDRAVWHFLVVLLSFCLMDWTHIHFHPDSVPKRKSKPCIDVWDSAYSTFTGSMHAFWSASFKIHAYYEALARFKERKKKTKLHLHRPLAENTVNHYWQTSEVQRGTALISGWRNNFLWKNCISARGERLPDADTK